MLFSEHFACVECGISIEEIAPRNFSFNSPYGACPACHGLGTHSEFDRDLILDPDEALGDRRRLIPFASTDQRVHPADPGRGRPAATATAGHAARGVEAGGRSRCS